ncbi:cytidine deaminase [Rossellomorea marisflavi]|uniref:cytidine deaminase n=1 Tax=Rossellomorea marisflavi TaxID=189381 RepID=UPI0035142806
MNTLDLTPEDFELIESAKDKITMLYKDDKHHVAAALRTDSGDIVSAVHIEAYIGRVTVCAEAIAVGSAVSSGHKGFHTIVAVHHPYSDEVDRTIRVVSPCGMCRELIADYSPECLVILEVDGKLVKTRIGELIPLKYTRSST